MADEHAVAAQSLVVAGLQRWGSTAETSAAQTVLACLKSIHVPRTDPSPDSPPPVPPLSPKEEGDPETYHRVLELLQAAKVPYAHLVHDQVRTSQEAADLRVKLGWKTTTLASGAKAMLVANKKDAQCPFTLFVMAADHGLDWKKAKKILRQGKNARLATEEEVLAVTGCLPGAVPPFGAAFKPESGVPVKTIVDASLKEQGDTVNFNCGLRTRSLRLATADYLRVATGGDVADVSSPPK